jgi:hypothetical protein
MDEKGHPHIEDIPNRTNESIVDEEYGEKKDLQYASEEIREQTRVLETPENLERIRRYMWKLDSIILPTISALYFFEYLDRGNIANAKLLGIANGHGTTSDGVGPGKKALNATQWETVIMIFYVGLILFQVPGCIGYRIFPPSKVCQSSNQSHDGKTTNS